MSKNIGILGSGAVAKALGAGFIKHGYNVMLGTTNADKLTEWKEQTGAQVGSFADAAAFGDILVLALKGHAAIEVINQAGLDHFKGKTVIDPTNPIDEKNPPVNGVLNFFTGPNSSLMEQLQATVPEANFVKAFNSIGSGFMVNPPFAEKPSMFICGNSDTAKAEVTAILDLFGFEVQDMGKAEAARAIEPLCTLWCIPGFLHNQWTHAFRLIKL